MTLRSGQPLVSIVIPNYNYGRFVCDAVESALAQNYEKIEVIVVDDGSTDDSRDRLLRFGSNINLICQANQGLSAARNRGMEAASGAMIALLDSDDLFHPQKIAHQVAYIQQHSDVSLLATGIVQGHDPEWADCKGSGEPLEAISLTLKDLILRTQFLPSSVLMRAEVFRELGGFNPALKAFEDREYWIRTGKRFGVAKLLAPWTFYRTEHVSMSYNVARLERFERMILAETFRDPELKKGFDAEAAHLCLRLRAGCSGLSKSR